MKASVDVPDPKLPKKKTEKKKPAPTGKSPAAGSEAGVKKGLYKSVTSFFLKCQEKCK